MNQWSLGDYPDWVGLYKRGFAQRLRYRAG
jgi:hypothetical protein